MLGAIFGDMVGFPYEKAPIKTLEFPLWSPESTFSDDTVLTVATAEAKIMGLGYTSTYQTWGRKYSTRGFGGKFYRWIMDPKPRPYNSFGNGSAMRVSPLGFLCSSLEDTLKEAELSALVSHNHPEGVKGAQAVAAAIWLIRNGGDLENIKNQLQRMFEYNLNRSTVDVRSTHLFDVTCQGSVPEALLCAFEATSVEHAVRLAVSLGGDADTQACIAGAVAEARFGFPEKHVAGVLDRLPLEMREIVDAFYAEIGPFALP